MLVQGQTFQAAREELELLYTRRVIELSFGNKLLCSNLDILKLFIVTVYK